MIMYSSGQPNYVCRACMRVVSACACAFAHVLGSVHAHVCVYMRVCACLLMAVLHVWMHACAYAIACGLRLVHAHVHMHVPLCVCKCICHTGMCAYVRVCGGACMHMCEVRVCLCHFCSCIIFAMESFSGVNLHALRATLLILLCFCRAR